ncbi:MAG: nucleotidyltransferase family protein [Hyphomicrobiales bacterium]
MTTVGLLLAAGHSRRFGEDNKLLAPYRGRPLVSHAADAMREAGLDYLIATVSDERVADLLEGFDLCRLTADGLPQSASLRAGILHQSALSPHVFADRPHDFADGLSQILVVLGDMPLVTSDHLRAVVDRCSADSASASTDGKRRMPPACFPRSMSEDLLATTGDRGAGPLLKTLPDDALVEAPRGMLKDVDTVEDLD